MRRFAPAPNHRGVLLPRSLGLLVLAGAAAWTLGAELAGQVGRAGWVALAGCGVVFAAGLVDDLIPTGPRGLRGHLRALLQGRVSTGVVKLVAIAGAAVLTVGLADPRPGWVRLAGAMLVAAAANAANALDVRPGRTLKASLPVALAAALAGAPGRLPPLLGALAGAAAALPFDLRERAMLGDSGANLVGFAAGLGLYGVLPAWAVAAAAAAAVALNLLAETVTFSALIERSALLRKWDRLGRLPD